MHRNLWQYCVAAVLALLGVTHSLAQTPAKQATGFDLLIRNATIVTMDSDRRIIEDGVVAVKGDAIAFVGTRSDFALHFIKGVTAPETFDAKGALVLPGFINGHTHAPMTLLR